MNNVECYHCQYSKLEGDMNSCCKDNVEECKEYNYKYNHGILKDEDDCKYFELHDFFKEIGGWIRSNK